MIEIINFTQKPLEHIGIVAGTCWGSPLTDSEKNKKRAIECIDNGHGRVTEFANVTLVLSEYSARVIREWYTHRIGNSNLQESTRYVNCNDFRYFTPPKIKSNKKANEIYDSIMKNISDGYGKLIELGIAKEDVANVLPLGMETKVVSTLNLRSLMSMYEVRECTRAYHEYRKVMRELKIALSTLDEDWKYICDNYLVAKCEKLGYCNEKYSCGKFPTKK